MPSELDAVIANAKAIGDELAQHAGTTEPMSDMCGRASYAISTLLAALDEAREDSKRLDWLDTQEGAIGDLGHGDYEHYFAPGTMLYVNARATIDAARAVPPTREGATPTETQE